MLSASLSFASWVFAGMYFLWKSWKGTLDFFAAGTVLCSVLVDGVCYPVLPRAAEVLTAMLSIPLQEQWKKEFCEHYFSSNNFLSSEPPFSKRTSDSSSLYNIHVDSKEKKNL